MVAIISQLFDFCHIFEIGGRRSYVPYIIVDMKTQMQNTNEKPMIDDEMAYFFGLSRGSYGEVLGELSRTKVNSWRTSSIPLAEFWQPANLGAIRRVLGAQLADFNPEVALKFFEFPTEAVWNGKRLGRPSMTDIMILDADWQVAVEGKFTEYLYGGGEAIIEWLRECTSVTDVQFRRDVLRAWIGYIRQAGCTTIPTVGELCRSCRDVAYQFLHRTASACHMANGSEGRTPVLVYQLFFDRDDAAHVSALTSFKANLRRWAAALRLRNMKFLILSVPVTNMAEARERFSSKREEMFDIMRSESPFTFDFAATTVESVIDTSKEGK